MRKHQGKRYKIVRKPGKHIIGGITLIITGTLLPQTKRQNVSMINIDRVFHKSANLRELFMVIIFIHNFQNKKWYKVIGCYLTEISQLIHLTILAKPRMLKITR